MPLKPAAAAPQQPLNLKEAPVKKVKEKEAPVKNLGEGGGNERGAGGCSGAGGGAWEGKEEEVHEVIAHVGHG